MKTIKQEKEPQETVVKESIKVKENIGLIHMIEAFSTNEAIMGQVNNCFMKWADLSKLGANAPQCEELAVFFARAVDGAKHGGVAEIPPQ